MPDSIERMFGAEKLTAVFNHWPKFHDEEFVWIPLDREGPSRTARHLIGGSHSEPKDRRSPFSSRSQTYSSPSPDL
ncbi:MAG TPA: hypothetical protein VK797_08825 [Tepidisphaeraceae bacterium]|nr:hypothetical protein [Tepidisphaeraceae bacterium]